MQNAENDPRDISRASPRSYYIRTLRTKPPSRERNVVVLIALTIFEDEDAVGLLKLISGLRQRRINRALNAAITSFIRRKRRSKKGKTR